MSTFEQDGTVLARQFQLFLEAVNEYAIFLLDADGRVATWNAGVEEILGYSEEDVLGKHFSFCYPEEDREQGKPDAALETALRRGEWCDEGWRLRKDGSRVWVRVTITPLHDENGDLHGYAKITRDLTAQRRARRALEEAEEKFRVLAENTAVGIALIRDDVFVFVNPALTDLAGYANSELTGRSPEAIYHPDDWPDVRRELDRRLDGEKNGLPFWARVRTRAGDTRLVEVRANRISYRGMPALIETVYDVTEQRDREEALRQSERKFRALAEQSLVGIEMIQDGVYTYVNPTFAGYFGYEADELIGDSPKQIIHPSDWPRTQDLIERRLRGEQRDARYTIRGRTRDGETVYLNTTGRRIEYEGRPAIVGASLNVTREHQLEEELLQVQDEERERLGYDLHDGVGPLLTAAAMATKTLTRATEKGKKVHPSDFDKIAEYIGQAADEVQSLSHGLSPLGLELGLPVALRGLAAQADSGHDLSCTFDEGASVPNLPETVAIHLYRIAQEAVANAARHGEANRIWIRLATDSDGAVVLTVEDNGHGYTQSPDEREGLGMRTMRHRANLINARFAVETAPEKGTLITCRVPLERLGEPPEDTAPNSI